MASATALVEIAGQVVISAKEYADLVELKTRLKMFHDKCDEELNTNLALYLDGKTVHEPINNTHIYISDIYSCFGWQEEIVAIKEEAQRRKFK